jgi:hypothetical protein
MIAVMTDQPSRPVNLNLAMLNDLTNVITGGQPTYKTHNQSFKVVTADDITQKKQTNQEMILASLKQIEQLQQIQNQLQKQVSNLPLRSPVAPKQPILTPSQTIFLKDGTKPPLVKVQQPNQQTKPQQLNPILKKPVTPSLAKQVHPSKLQNFTSPRQETPKKKLIFEDEDEENHGLGALDDFKNLPGTFHILLHLFLNIIIGVRIF